MTRVDKFEEIFGYRPATDQVLCNEHDCGESDACDYCMCNPDNIGLDEDWWNAEYKEPTTKIDYRRAFKITCDLLNGDVLYGVDADDIYELMMKKDGVVSSSSYEEYILNHLQELDQGQYASEPTPKNDLGVDCISRADAIQAMQDKAKKITNEDTINGLCGAVAILFDLPSVTPQESCENNICDSCHTKGCIFQSGIKRVNCEFYTTQNEPCNDAISRESLLNKLCGYQVDIEKSIFDKLWRVIKAMPSVIPQEPILDKIDEIITDALDKSTDQKESQTLRWVLDKISEVEDERSNKSQDKTKA